MQIARHPRRRAAGLFAIALFALGAVMALWAGVLTQGQPSPVMAQSGPCGTTHDALDAQELEFLGHFRDWRAANNLTRADLEVSGALNAAAAWFAEHLVGGGAQGGHVDAYGRNWAQRALDCGYSGTTSGGTPFAFGSGEGTFFLQAGGQLNVTPFEAVYGGTIGSFQHSGVTYPGSGAWLSVGGSLPGKCVGVGRAQNSAGTAVAWIVLVAQYPANAPCPESNVWVQPTASPTASPTATATASPTPSPTPSPTAEPLWQSYAPGISAEVGW
jgi:hypothetical protein